MTTSKPYERRYDAMREVRAFPGVTRRTLGSGERLTLVEIRIDEGHEVPEHTHPHEQAGQVVEGRVRFRIGGQELELQRGDAYLIPGGVEHHVVALESATLIEAFSPVREDFLPDLQPEPAPIDEAGDPTMR
jgi:quercetin dioxygenase-like cupin family protein